MRKRFLQMPKRSFLLCVFSLAACTILSGYREEFALLQDDMEEELPYLSQEEFEEQLKLRLNENIYYEGRIADSSPLLSYRETVLDYIALHQKLCDKEEAGYTQSIVSILLQPQEEGLATTLVNLTVYNNSIYELSFQGSLDGRVDLRDTVGAKEKIVDWLGLPADSGGVKIWYQGTVTVGNGEKPEYSDLMKMKSIIHPATKIRYTITKHIFGEMEEWKKMQHR